MNTHLEILVKELIKNGVSAKCCEIITDFHGNPSASEPFLDFSEHDKKVAEEKDKRIAELEKQIGGYRERNILLRQRCTAEARDLFDCEMFGSLVVTVPNKSNAENKINLNDRVKVKLTPLGVEIFYHQYDELNKITKANGGTPLEPVMPQIDKDGYTEFTLHHFISLYGKHIGMAKPNVIQPINIIIV